jgi:NTE family protein
MPHRTIIHEDELKRPGLVLSGGGARGAYQAGVVKGIADIASDLGIRQPLPILTGISAGAINASYLASGCDDFSLAAEKMSLMWSRLTADRVFKTDALAAGRSGLRLITDATVGALYQKKLARSLLDTTPLRHLMTETIPFDRIQQNIIDGHLKALAITAMNYANSTSITFVQGRPSAPMWTRARRRSERSTIDVPHVMASSALPLFFPPVKVGDHHFGDGTLRNQAPLSPAIHLGAQKLIVVSVRKSDAPATTPTPSVDPSLARVLGVMLNALLLDSLDADMERMSRINTTVSLVPEEQRQALSLRPVDYLWIRPSQDIGQLAGDLFERLPRVIRYLVGGLGSSREASELTSYLLFDPDFCGQLVAMGHKDALAQRDQIAKFISS